MKNKGQAVLEYALVVATITMAFIAMFIFIQRSVNSNAKILQDQVEVKPRPR